jgi:RNA polymerase sigma-70 factor (ECF subfamily)
MPPGNRALERGLWHAALAGDERAWRAWYEASFAPLYAYTLWRCAGLRDVADEIVQETWLIAVRRLREFDPERAKFIGWLRGVAANQVRNYFRKEKRRPVRSLGDTDVPAPKNNDLESRERAERIAQALGGLPEHYEAVLRAKYLDQESVADIAAGRDESVKAVESLLTRARQALREALGAEAPFKAMDVQRPSKVRES